MKKNVDIYRFELLLASLLFVIFNKIFIFSDLIYSKFIWPLNMILLGLVSALIFREQKLWVRFIKNILFVVVIATPLFANYIFQHYNLKLLILISYISFYTIIFVEVMRQIIRKNEVTESVIMGSLSGFLILIMVSSFSFLCIDLVDPASFNNLSGQNIPQKYHQIIYFSSITLTTIGYGDITASTDNARLLSAFWGVVGQFYMVAVVGIIISKFTSK